MKKIFNFDHGIDQPTELVYGPFSIIINESHCQNIKRLCRRASTSFTYTDNFKPVVSYNPASSGETVETALIRLDDQNSEGSLLFPEIPWVTSYYDLVIILSFLTGRRVYLEEHLDECVNQRYLDGAVSKNFFRSQRICWENIPKIKDLGVSHALANLTMAYNARDLLGMSAYANSALDTITSSWINFHKMTKFNESKLINTCLTQAATLLEQSLLTRLQIKFLHLLTKEKIPKNIIQDITARISIKNISSPSALYKLKKFLSAYDLYDENASEMEEKRVKLLNTLRNSVTHTGKIPEYSGYNFEQRVQISLAVTLLVIQISQYYLAAEVLKVNDARLEQHKENIKGFFSTGKFNGHDVFNETYEDYLSRLEDKWVNEGEMISI